MSVPSAVLAQPGNASARDRIFFTGMALLASAIVFWGFAPTFYLRDSALPSLSTVQFVHGVVFSAWFVLLITQTSLIAANRRDIHRKLGAFGAALAVVMVFVGLAVAVDSLRRGAVPLPGLDPRSFFALPFWDMVVFAGLVAGAVHFRKTPETHKRLMVVASLSILSAAIARIPLEFIAKGGPPVFFGLVDLMILGAIAYDFATRRRVHPAYLWAGGAVLFSHVFRLAISGTGPWLAFADLFLP